MASANMPPESRSLDATVASMLQHLDRPFWNHLDFWIFLLIGITGVVLSYRAFVEARQAKRAATAAGRTVKLQTVTIELNEISLKLDRLQTDITFSQARDLVAETSRRVRRAVASFARDHDLKDAIASVLAATTAAQTSLNAVRPDAGKEADVLPGTYYYAIQNELANVNNLLADLSGLFEQATTNPGEQTDGEP